VRSGRHDRHPYGTSESGPAGKPARSAERALLRVQRQAGNRAAAAVLAGLAESEPARPVQRSATMDLGLWNTTAKPTDTYEIAIDALTDDIVGHAWIEVSELQGAKRRASIGFWPQTEAILPWGGRGRLDNPDAHTGQQNHRAAEKIDRRRFLDVLNVVNAWEGSYYQILYRNCAHFARAAWTAGTGHPDGVINESGPTIWTPGEQADVIDAGNRARGLDPQGRPLEPDR
jgi:hypothetical protein